MFKKVQHKISQLIRLKIAIRENEHPPRPRGLDERDHEDGVAKADAAGIGRNEGTVRFKFGPERLCAPVTQIDRAELSRMMPPQLQAQAVSHTSARTAADPSGLTQSAYDHSPMWQ